MQLIKLNICTLPIQTAGSVIKVNVNKLGWSLQSAEINSTFCAGLDFVFTAQTLKAVLVTH
jgi:hypothetical protein